MTSHEMIAFLRRAQLGGHQNPALSLTLDGDRLSLRFESEKGDRRLGEIRNVLLNEIEHCLVDVLAREMAEIESHLKLNQPKLTLVDVPSDPDPIGPRLRQLHDDALAATGFTAESPSFSITTKTTQNLGAQSDAHFFITGKASDVPVFLNPTGGLEFCQCRPIGIIASNLKADCRLAPCACRCHPENR